MDKFRGLICFGDSVFSGTGASDRQRGCTKILKNACTFPVSIKGKNRDSSRDAILRIEEDVLRQKELSHVLILFGNNDSWLDKNGKAKVSIDEFRLNLSTMIKSV